MSQSRRELLEEMINEAREFRFCGLSDDPDRITAVTSGYMYIVTHLKRLAGPLLPEGDASLLDRIEVTINDLLSAYEAKAEIDALLPAIEEVAKYADELLLAGRLNTYLIDPDLVEELRELHGGGFDTSLLARMCVEINSSYAHGNVLAAALVMRSVLNYIPPAFGKSDFKQVAAEVGRSLKELFGNLEDGLRKIADFHAHRQMGKGDAYPSRAQVEPYRAPFELLLQETAKRVREAGSPAR